MNILTSSALSAFRDCPRRYHHAYERKRVPVTDAAPLAFGKLWHEVMDAWWWAGSEHAVAYLVEKADEIKEEDAAKIAALLKHYRPPHDRFDVLDVEKYFEVKIDSPTGGRAFRSWRLAGKVDVLVREKATDHIWIIDHKTTASQIIGFGDYWQHLQVDGQMANYCLAFDARGFIYDVVKKPTIKLCGKDEKAAPQHGGSAANAYQARIEESIREDKEPWYQWREHPKLKDDTREARFDLWQQVQMVRECSKQDRYPRNSNACVGRYGACPYMKVCTYQADIDDDALFRTKEETHEELK
jgi:hypothetical protein